MKTKLGKALWAMMMVLVLLTPAAALGQARFPADRGAVTDDASVLPESLVANIAEFQTVALSRTGVKVQVAVVHFLDGLDAQTYAQELFARWDLGENDFLLLGAVGEDQYASASGTQLKKTWSDNNAQLLLSTSGFGELFKKQQYEQAFSQFFVAFGQTLGRLYSADMNLNGLFSAYGATQATPAPAGTRQSFVSSLWNSIQEGFDDSAMGYVDYHEQREREQGGLSPAGWVLLIVLIGIVFSQSDPARRARKTMGCGCGPLGWIFGLIGIGKLWRRR